MIKIYGDSHSRIFKKIKLNRFKLNVENVSGASLIGLPKSNSKLKLRSKIITYLKNNKPDFLILKFGQVDIDLGYYYRIVVSTKSIFSNKESSTYWMRSHPYSWSSIPFYTCL